MTPMTRISARVRELKKEPRFAEVRLPTACALRPGSFLTGNRAGTVPSDWPTSLRHDVQELAAPPLLSYFLFLTVV